MRSCVTCLALWLFTLGVCPVVVSAQEPDAQYEAPPHLSVLEGDVALVRDGRTEAAPVGHILVTGDRIATGEGRAEMLFGDGSALHVDARTTIDILDDGLLRLMAGRAYLHVSDSGARFQYRIDTPAASVFTDSPGEYRLLVEDGREPVLELAVARGLASATTPRDSVAVRAGQMVRVRAGAPPGRPVAFNAAYWDDFGRWSYERRFGPASVDAGGLPAPLTTYAGTFATYGHWDRHPTYGPVWYPRVVSGWRPFHYGRWTSVAPYGWTWAGADPWAWPTHHYGTWGVSGVGAWFWVPGPIWRPAPVHWTLTAGYVGWVPWGYGSVGAYGFTLIPRSAFSVNVFVPPHVVHVHSVRPVVHNAFVAYPPPAPYAASTRRAFAMPRGPAPVRVGVPRYGSPPSASLNGGAVVRNAGGANAGAGNAAVAGRFPSQTATSRASTVPQAAIADRTPAASVAGSARRAIAPPVPAPTVERQAVPRFSDRQPIEALAAADAVVPGPVYPSRVSGTAAYRSRSPRVTAPSPEASPAPPQYAAPRSFEMRQRYTGNPGVQSDAGRPVPAPAPRAESGAAEAASSRRAVPRHEGSDHGDGGGGGGARRRQH